MSDKSELNDTNGADQPQKPGANEKDSGPAVQRRELYESIKGSSAASTEPSIARAGSRSSAAAAGSGSGSGSGSATNTYTATAGASATDSGSPGEDAAPAAAPKPSSSGFGKDVSGPHGILDRQAQETREELLEQFYSTLRVTYSVAKPDPGPGTRLGEQHRRIRDLLENRPRSWLYAYEIEQLLVFAMTDDQLEAELPRRMAEAKEHKLEYVSTLSAQLEQVSARQENATTDTERESCRLAKQYIFQRLLNDLQWFFNQRIRRRDAATRLTVRVSAMFLSAFLFFSTLLFIQYLSAGNAGVNQSPNAPQQQTVSATIKGGSKSSEIDAQSRDKKDAKQNKPNRD